MGNKGTKPKAPGIERTDTANKFIIWQKHHTSLGHQIGLRQIPHRDKIIDEYSCKMCDEAFILHGYIIKGFNQYLEGAKKKGEAGE